MDKPKAIENPDNICFKCLKEIPTMNLHKIVIPEMGYGSGFDGWTTKLNLCDDCIKETNSEWWELEVISDEYSEEYKHENKIFNYIKTLPLESQELFYNRLARGWNADHRMDSQDWIDYELDLLPHEKCKQYARYSPEEIKAYHEKFPICNKVKIVIYGDSSRGSKCPFGAFGNKDGTGKGHQTQDECYGCIMFEKREGDIETYSKEEMDIFELENKLALARFKQKLKEL